MSWLLFQELTAGALLAGLAQWLATHITFWPARSLTPEAHWTERAKRSWGVRVLITLGPVVLLGINLARAGSDHSGWESTLRLITLPTCVALGAMIGSLPVTRRVFGRPVGLSDLLREYAVLFLVLGPAATVLLVMLVLLFPHRLGTTSVSIMIGSFIVALALTLGLAVPIVRAFGLLAPPPPRLQEIVRAASEQARISPPPVYLLRWHQANAVAFPFARLLAFTGPALDILTDRELHAVCLHEIAHLQESTRHKLIRLSGLMVLFPLFTFPVWSKAYGLPGVLLPLGIYILGNRLLGSFNQRMEHAADAAACGEDQSSDAVCYAQALEKIYRFNMVPAVMRGKAQSHPHLYDRLVAAGITPEYPRPKAPSILLSMIAVVLLLAGTIVPLDFLNRWSRETEASGAQHFLDDSSDTFSEE